VAQNLSLLCAAGNVEVPSYLVLREKGYIVKAYDRPEGHSGWYAEKDGSRFQGDSLIEVLGLVSMFEVRGTNWAASDQDIDDFLKTYDN
jgi:hypothetical protein